MKALFTALILTSFVYAPPTFAQANLFKCTDAEGRVEYRELPLREQTCELIRGPARSSVDPDAALNELRERVQGVERSREENDRIAQVRARERESCENARRNLTTLTSGQPITRQNAAGEPERVPPEEIPNLIAETERQIGFFCKD